jgi:hypothetical protein
MTPPYFVLKPIRSSDEVRGKLAYLQSYLVREVYAAFARLAGLPEHTSRQIEDLEDLRRLDTALSALAERQERIEVAVESAVWFDGEKIHKSAIGGGGLQRVVGPRAPVATGGEHASGGHDGCCSPIAALLTCNTKQLYGLLSS